MKRFVLHLTLLFLFSSSLFAQNHLRSDFKIPSGVPNVLNVCGAPDTAIFVIRTEGISAAQRSGIVSTLELFAGIEYVAFLDQLSSPGVFVASIANKNKPSFTVPNLSPSGGTSFIEIALLIAADCKYADSIAINGTATVRNAFKHSYILNGQSLQETDFTSEYRNALKSPVLSIAAQQNILPPARVGQCFSRSFIIANGALEGFTDTVIYTNKQGAGVSITQVYIDGVAIPVTKTVQGIDTIITAKIAGNHLKTAKIGSAAGNGDIYFDPNESLVVKEDFCLKSCAISRLSRHTAAWGCKGRVCVSTAVDGFVQTGQGQPNALITNTPNDPANVTVGYCKPGALKIVYRNSGVAIDPGFADMINLEVVLGMTNLMLLNHPYITTTKITLAGVNMPLTASIPLINNPLFATDPDGASGLTDLDGDGFFDDLGAGQSFTVLVNFEFNCQNARQPGADSLCLNDINVVWNTQLRYLDPCGVTISKSLGNFGGIQSSNEEYDNCIDTDAYPNQKFSVQHIETRGVRNFDKSCGGMERFVVWAKLPSGVTASAADFKIFKNNSSFEIPRTKSYQSGDTLFVEFDATNPFLNGKYDVRTLFTPDCTVPIGRILIPFGFQLYCPGCECRHDWYCDVLEGPQFHPTVPPCPSGITCPAGLQTTDFDVERTTFGFTGSDYTTRVTKATANTDVAIQCDSVRMTVCNVVGQTPITDSIGVIIAYDNVDFIRDTNQIFLFDKGTLRINRGGQILTCPVDKSMLKVTAGDTSKVLKFDFSSCLASLGVTLQSGDSVKFYGDFLVNPQGAMLTNFKKIPNFRSYGFAVQNGDTLACDNYGENFFVCKIPTVFAIPGGPDFPKGCANTPFSYRLITKNVGFDDYYTNEFYPAVKVDSIVLEFDTTLISTFNKLEVKVSIPGHPVHGNNFYTIHKISAADKGRYVARFDTLVQFPSYNIVQSYSFNLQVSVSPGCESLTGSSTNNNLYKLNPTIYYSDNYFAKWFGDGSCSPDTAIFKAQNLTYSEPPTVSFDPVSNPSIFLTSDTAVWVVKQCNTSTKSDALLTWMATGFDTTKLQLVSVELIDDPNNPQVLAIQSFGSGKSFVLTPALFRQSNNNTSTAICNFLRIKAIPKICGTAPVRLDMGWNCSPYDDPNWTPDSYAPCVADTLGLQFTTLDASVEATIVGQPPVFPSVCDTVSLEVLVRNNGRGTLFDVNSIFSIPLQAGDYVKGSAQIAWPSDAPFQKAIGDPILLGTTVKGQFYSFPDFNLLHKGLEQNGLIGFDPSSPSKENEFRVKYSFVAGCGFRGGAQVFYQFTGFQSCGQPSNYEAGESLPIFFSGLVPPPGKSFDPLLDLTSVLSSGTASTLELDITNLTSTPSDLFDMVTIKLPSGINYVPGSTVTIQPASWGAANPKVENVSGINILTWSLPAGMALNDTATLRFNVVSPALACNAQLEAALSTIRDTAIVCSTGAQTCTASIITSKEEKYVTIGVGQNASFAGGDKTQCTGGQVQLGTVNPAFVSYQWEPAALVNNASIATPTANIQSSTIFTVAATDTSGCVKMDTVRVTISNPINIQMTAQTATCGLNNGSVLVAFSGAGANSTYNWVPTNITGSNPTGLAAGTYTVVITDPNLGCSATQSVQVSPQGVGAAFSALPIHQTTIGQAGSISVLFSQGTDPYTVSWAGPNGASGSQAGISALGYEITPLSAGVYTVTVTGSDGCSAQQTVEIQLITINNLVVTRSTVPDTSCCFGAGVATLQVQGGVAPYMLQLLPNMGTIQNLTASVLQVTGLEAGTYQATITDTGGSTTTVTFVIDDACQCAEIFEEEIVYDVSGIEALCLPIPLMYFGDYELLINGDPYTGPVQACDIDTVVTYAFSYLRGEGFDGPYKLTSWTCNQVTIANVVFHDLYDLVDSMNVWDPNGFWLLDDNTSTIYGGDLDQVIYGDMNMMHMPSWTPYTAKVNYTDFAYGSEIFVNPFEDKYVVTAYDSLTCCSDTMCIILLNPCEQLIPLEPYVLTMQQPQICLPLPFANQSDYLIFYDSKRVFQTTACDNGAGTSFTVPAVLGQHKIIVIDIVNLCADTVLVEIGVQPTLSQTFLTTAVNQGIVVCGDSTELIGIDLSTSVCGTQTYGTLALVNAMCWTYTPNLNFIGIDTVCINTCDEFGYCDSSIFIVTIVPPAAHLDTMIFDVPANTPNFLLCADSTELFGNIITGQICSTTTLGTLTQVPPACFMYTPNAGAFGTDQACVILCDNNGLCDTTIFILANTPPLLPPTPDTLRLNTFVNVPIPNICPVLSQIGGSAANIQYCGQPVNGIATLQGNCATYQPNLNFVGIDSFCLYVCNAAGICDTTRIYITIEPDLTGGLTKDTIQIVTQVNTESQWFCLSLLELGGNAASFDLCASPGLGVVTLNSPCFYYTPAQDVIGSDEFCLVLCNAAGQCDTTIVQVIIQLNTTPTDRDTIYVTTESGVTSGSYCVDLNQLGGTATGFSLCNYPTNGVAFLSTPCFNYTPNPGFVGNDEFCVVACNSISVCDTTIVIVSVTQPQLPTIDTLNISTFINTPTANTCVSLNQIGNALTTTVCAQPTSGQVVLVDECFEYTPNAGFVGTDQFCVVACNSSNLCDTTIINVTVTQSPLPSVDTIYITTLVNAPTPNTCVSLTQIGAAMTTSVCDQPNSGQVALTAECFVYTPAANFVGTDQFCIVACNASVICDTTIVIVTVTPAPTPTTDTLYITTLVNTPTPNTCVSLTQIGTALTTGLCAQPASGQVAFTASCFVYTPNTGFVGTDQFCVVACNAANVCDTTIVIVTVTQPQLPTKDTLYVTTLINTPSANTCVSLTQIGTALTTGLCAQPASGQVAFTASCFVYTPNTGFVGTDQFCVVACNAANVCDTTIVIVTVNPNPIIPIGDTITVTTPYQTPTTPICITGAGLGVNTLLSFCSTPVNGFIIPVNDSCLIYDPLDLFVGTDTICVLACDSSLTTCDTITIIVTVLPPTPIGSNIDTIRVNTPFQTTTLAICLDTAQLSGIPTSFAICNQPNNGTLVQLNDTCVAYGPNMGFVGLDTVCVIICDTALVCDTTIIIINVLPPVAPDCGLFDQDTMTIEIFNGALVGLACAPIRLDSVPAFDWFLDGNPYTGPFVGCNFDSCFDYTYFTIPDFGDKGPYLLEYWKVNNQSFTTTFQDIEGLVDSMNVWDTLGNWYINAATLTIVSCERTANVYGDMRVTQIASGAVGVLDLNVNLIPKGTAMLVPVGQHQIIVQGPNDCADTLNVIVQPARVFEIDTFIYVNSGADTLCLADYGVNLQGVTTWSNICPQFAGNDIQYSLDSTNYCIQYTGINPGQDSLCIKLGYGNDSCAYVYVTITVLAPLPCIDFITQSSANGTLDKCNGTDTVLVCVDLPYALLSEFTFTANGQAMPTVQCPPNAQGIPQIGVVFNQTGMYTLLFSRTAMNCRDSVLVAIGCNQTGNSLMDTIAVNTSDSLCLDLSGFAGGIVSVTNICPTNSGNFVDFDVTTSAPYCVTYAGLAVGMETACIQVCDSLGVCDTILVQVTVIPQPNLNPIAVADYDTLTTGFTIAVPIFDNDTINGNWVSTRIIITPMHGTAILNPAGYIYTADTSKCESRDSLLYEICNQNGCDTAWSYLSLPCMKFKVYTGFSPNGDMINDFFHIDGLGLFPNHGLKVYNRWGARVLETAQYRNNWDGDWNGRPLPDGIYFWIFDTGLDGQVYSGCVTIMR
jgi:gliding motility-associated-like protein